MLANLSKPLCGLLALQKSLLTVGFLLTAEAMWVNKRGISLRGKRSNFSLPSLSICCAVAEDMAQEVRPFCYSSHTGYGGNPS